MPSDPGPLTERNRHFSQHVCCEHLHQVACEKDNREVSSRGGEGKKEEAPGGLSTETLSIFSLIRLSLWDTGCGGW